VVDLLELAENGGNGMHRKSEKSLRNTVDPRFAAAQKSVDHVLRMYTD
jgi:hypothetical protein